MGMASKEYWMGHCQAWSRGRKGWSCLRPRHLYDIGECFWSGITASSRPTFTVCCCKEGWISSVPWNLFYCWLVLWDLRKAPFDISLLWGGGILLFSLFYFSSTPNCFGQCCCYWQLPLAALKATRCEGMFTFPQLRCLWTVLNLTLIKPANNNRGSFFFFIMNVTCLSWKDMLLILAFHLNQESNTKQKSI